MAVNASTVLKPVGKVVAMAVIGGLSSVASQQAAYATTNKQKAVTAAAFSGIFQLAYQVFTGAFTQSIGKIEGSTKFSSSAFEFEETAGGTGLGQKEPAASLKTAQEIISANRVGTTLKNDIYHRSASYLSQQQLATGKTFTITGGDGVERTLLQVGGELDGVMGVFEYLIDPNGIISHQLFKAGGIINGIIN